MSCKTNKKRLDTLKKRKRVINNLFKKDKNINKILMKYEQNLLYEDPEEEMRIHRNEQCTFQIFKFVKKNKNYTDFYLKNVEFGPSSEFFAAGALGSGIETGQYISTHLLHIKYNKNLDSFVATAGISSNTYNKLCIFNDAKNFSFDIWENEDTRSKSNSFVGEEIYKKISSSKLPKNILNLFTKNTFDELYKQVWEKNNKKLKPLVYYYITGREAQISDIHISNILYYNEDRLASSQGEILDNQYIYYKGIKSKGLNKNPDSFYEKITIKISPNDVIIAEANYPHSPTTHWTITNSEQETFIVTGSSGIFKDANKIVVEYDNDLTKDFSQSLDQEIKNQGLKFRKITVTF